ncbi:odorant receptor 56a-like isoform X1 [Hermetia illucens]|uniref:odorant receptor 56a-like isoform X1 n=1 Tax=Hermetia illucens TaxID=343691 RepID=UPI0018CC08AC|nr:odorant receptor 56a-like isoform X1 [Hermetia illucens]
MLENFALDAEVFDNPLLKWQLTTLKLMGYIFLRTDSFRLLHFLRGVLVSISIFVLVFAQARSIWLHSDNLERLSPALGSSITYGNVFTRVIAFYCYQERYNQMLTHAKAGLKKILATSLPKEILLYNSYINYITTMSHTIMILMTGAVVLLSIEGVYFIIHQSQEWTIPRQEGNSTKAKGMNHLFVLYCTGSLSESFFFTFILPYYMLLVGGCFFFTWQTISAALMRLISFRLDVIKYRLENISEYANNLLAKVQPNENHKHAPSYPKVLKYVLGSCVEDLTEIKLFASNYEHISSITVFIESATTSALLCLQLYILSKDFSVGDIIYASWSVATVGLLWIYYWHANEISDKSNEITNALYSLNWYEQPLYLQKDIAVFMAASMKPIIMKSAFLHINIDSFCTILKTSYSYFTFLQNFVK